MKNNNIYTGSSEVKFLVASGSIIAAATCMSKVETQIDFACLYLSEGLSVNHSNYLPDIKSC